MVVLAARFLRFRIRKSLFALPLEVKKKLLVTRPWGARTVHALTLLSTSSAPPERATPSEIQKLSAAHTLGCVAPPGLRLLVVAIGVDHHQVVRYARARVVHPRTHPRSFVVHPCRLSEQHFDDGSHHLRVRSAFECESHPWTIIVNNPHDVIREHSASDDLVYDGQPICYGCFWHSSVSFCIWDFADNTANLNFLVSYLNCLHFFLSVDGNGTSNINTLYTNKQV